MMSHPWSRCWLARLATLLVSVALLAMACGDDDSGGATSTSTTEAPAVDGAPSRPHEAHFRETASKRTARRASH
jgi:hypothetical protein